MKESAQNNIRIELHVPDFEIAKDFYGKLGFKLIWERKPRARKGYLVMKRGNGIICFYCGNKHVSEQSYFKQFPKDTKRGYAVEIVVPVKNIEGFYNRVKLFAKVVGELKEKHWGLKDFRIEDPFGFYVRFAEPYDILNPKRSIPQLQHKSKRTVKNR